MTIHTQTHPKPVTEGFSFLGFRVYPHQRRLKPARGWHFQRKFRQAVQAYQTGQKNLTELTASVAGWVNHVRYANTVGLRQAILSHPIPRLIA